MKHSPIGTLAPLPEREELRDVPLSPRLIIEISRLLRSRLLSNESGVMAQGTARLIMSLLAKHAGKVLTYDFIMKELWGPRAGNDNQILRVNMANIRRKIEENPAEPKYLFTEVGVGYRIAEPD